MNNFWTRIISGIFMISVVILLINQGQIGINILAIIIGLGSHYEWLKLKDKLSNSNLADRKSVV